MPRPLAAAGLLASLAFAVPAPGETADQPCPPVPLNAVINGAGETSLQDFRDRVVFLDAFATW
jgi:hypothetical protein